MHFMKRFSIKNMLPIKKRIAVAPSWQGISKVSALCTNVEAQIKSTNAEIFKDDAAAKVVAIDLNGSRLVLKQYNVKNLVKFLTRSVRRSSAQKTWDNAQYLLNKGIETVRPVALIEDRIAFFTINSFFIGTFIPGQDARSFFRDASKAFSKRRAVVGKIVDSLLELHSKNIFVGDTKDTNIVIGPDDVFWVDLEELARPKWGWLKRKKMLRDWQVLFYNWRNDAASRQLFYDAVRDKLDRQHYWELVRHVALYRGKKFKINEIQSRLSRVTDNAGKILAQARQIAQGSMNSHWEKVESSGKAIVARRQQDGTSLYCKVFLARNKKEGLKRLFRPGRGERAVRNEQMMRAAGFSAPETLYWGRYKEREYTVCRGVEGTSVLAWLNQHRHNRKIKRVLLRRLGEEVAALHLAGFAHGDLRMGNVLVEGSANDPRFVFIDNERTTLFRKIPRRLVIQNLRQINTDAISRLSRSDRLRIFRAYQKVYGVFEKEEEKRLISKIEDLTRKRLEAEAKEVHRVP